MSIAGVERVMTDFAITLGLTFFVVCLAFVLFYSVRVGRLTLVEWSILGIGGHMGSQVFNLEFSG